MAIRAASTLVNASSSLGTIWPRFWDTQQVFAFYPIWGRTLVILPSAEELVGAERLHLSWLPRHLMGRLRLTKTLPPAGLPFDMRFSVGERHIPAVSIEPPFGAYRSNAATFPWLTDSVASMVMFTVHELFHGFQERAFGKLPGEDDAFANTVPVRPYMHLLDSAALQERLGVERAELLLASRADTPAQCGAHVRAYDSLRASRLAEMPHVMSDYEDAHERIEGVANWVGYEGVRLAITHDSTGTRTHVESDLVSRYLDVDGSEARGWKSYSLWHLYVVGAAKASILDRLGFPQWKERLARGTSLERLLMEAASSH